MNALKKMWYVCTTEQYSTTKKEYPAICENMNKLVKSDKLDRKIHVLYDVTYMCNIKQANLWVGRQQLNGGYREQDGEKILMLFKSANL